jgi:hypothetical protein
MAGDLPRGANGATPRPGPGGAVLAAGAVGGAAILELFDFELNRGPDWSDQRRNH